MPLYNSLMIRDEEREEGTIGKETMSNIGSFIKDQYERIPENTREGFEQGVSEAATGIQSWNKQLREDNYWGGIGPLDPFIGAANVYNAVATPIKKEVSIKTGFAPSVVDLGEFGLDVLTPGIPLGAKKAKKLFKAKPYSDAISILDNSSQVNRKIRSILATNPNYSYRQAKELAELELKGIRPTGKLYSDRPDRGGLMDGAPIDEQSMWEAQQRQLTAKDNKRFTWRDIPGKRLWKSGKPDPKVTSRVDEIINKMDDWRLSHSDLDRPMTGFVKNYGRKPTFWLDGREYVVGWSRKKGTYEIDDLQKRIDRRASRLAGDKTSNPQSASIREIKIAISRDLNKQAKNLPVEEWDIIIQNPGDAYVEHLIAVKSPYWKTKRGQNSGYLAGDAKNLKVLTDQNFKTLKDNIEKHVHAKHKDYYVDYDPLSQNLIIRNLETGEALPTQIPGYGKAKEWKQYIDDTLAGKPMQGLEVVDPPIPPNVARQMENYEKARLTLDKLTDVEQNAILDYANGMSWKQIRAKYGKSINQSNLQLFKKKEYTKSEVLRILKEYRIDGKGRTKFNIDDIFPD